MNDTMPGDAEFGGAVSQIREQSGWNAGDLLMFVWPDAGFEFPTAACVREVNETGDLTVETLVGKFELAISSARVTRRL